MKIWTNIWIIAAKKNEELLKVAICSWINLQLFYNVFFFIPSVLLQHPLTFSPAENLWGKIGGNLSYFPTINWCIFWCCWGNWVMSPPSETENWDFWREISHNTIHRIPHIFYRHNIWYIVGINCRRKKMRVVFGWWRRQKKRKNAHIKNPLGSWRMIIKLMIGKMLPTVLNDSPINQPYSFCLPTPHQPKDHSGDLHITPRGWIIFVCDETGGLLIWN